MSQDVLEILASELEGVQAEESLQRATEIAAGSGVLEREEHRALWRGWQRQASIGARMQSAAAVALTAASMGLAVEREQAS